MSETHWRRVHRRKNDQFLFAEDIGPPGTSVDVEVVDSGVGEVKGSKGKTDNVPWVAFAGKKKRLGLNRTNSRTMESVCGTPTIEKWRGPITLVVVRVTFKDSDTKQETTTDAIRIAPTRPKPKQSAPQQDAAQEGAGQ